MGYRRTKWYCLFRIVAWTQNGRAIASVVVWRPSGLGVVLAIVLWQQSIAADMTSIPTNGYEMASKVLARGCSYDQLRQTATK